MRQILKFREYASAERVGGIQFRPGGLLSARGFTLIELMVVVAIIAILAAIAIPSYTSSVQKSRRSAAKTALLDLATREEKFYSLNNAYSSTPSDLFGTGAAPFPMNAPLTGQAFYQVSFNNTYPITTASGTSPATFAIQAVPINAQANDQCGTFYLNSAGQESVSTTATSCW
ncbi:MAG: type IV pilin protein [Burkholderiaceae bacterium]|nr:type IV pilin protein [Burkholderiaceae bacterium]